MRRVALIEARSLEPGDRLFPHTAPERVLSVWTFDRAVVVRLPGETACLYWPGETVEVELHA